MGNVHMEASQINYRGGSTKQSVEEALKNAGTSYELPIAASDTLGGVKVGTNLSINSESGVLSADAQLPEDPETDGTRVLTATTSSGETNCTWEIPESSIVDYSTSEVDTGIKWTDGKTIYRKVVDVGALPNNASKNVASGLTGESIIRMWGNAKDGGDVALLPFPATNTSYTITVNYNESTHNITIYTNTDMSAYSGVIVLEYTKTTT